MNAAAVPPPSSGSHGGAHGDSLEAIMALITGITGIHLPPAKRSMVENRLGKRLRQLGIAVEDYAQLVATDDQERRHAIDLVATNHSSWWREPAHFDDLRHRALPHALGAGARRLRIWCAAAAGGEEPYSIALCVHQAMRPGLDAAILATDISEVALARARLGQYAEQALGGLNAQDRKAALTLAREGTPAVYAVKPELRALVHFARLNLQSEWPMRGPFDIIFCRNVMIYFENHTKQRLIARLASLLTPGGTLYIGHAESLGAATNGLRMIQPSIYTQAR
jgi:chemotaxis protein methyltransferase CheR